MNDTISRQAAIAVADASDYVGLSVEDVKKVTDEVVKGLKRLPSAEPRWIPCSERLPEIKEHHVSEPCIVYCLNGAYGFAELEENIFGQVGWNCERDDEYHEPLGEVTAWMPLPKPYKEKENERWI